MHGRRLHAWLASPRDCACARISVMLACMMAAARSPGEAGTFSDYLRRVQNLYGFTSVAELARFLDIQQSSVSRWLDGSSEPSLANVRKISDRLDASVGEIMVEADILSKQDIGKQATRPRRLAPVLRDVQDFLDDPESTDREKQLLLKSIRGLLNIILEARG